LVVLEGDWKSAPLPQRDPVGASELPSPRKLNQCDFAPSEFGATRRETLMADGKFLTPEEVSERYRGGITVGTLRNWRAMRIGPTFVKIGKAVLYPTAELDAWDQKNTVTCRSSRRLSVDAGDEA
jgi:hypothetical protein